jgi:hypothetical protein
MQVKYPNIQAVKKHIVGETTIPLFYSASNDNLNENKARPTGNMDQLRFVKPYRSFR